MSVAHVPADGPVVIDTVSQGALDANLEPLLPTQKAAANFETRVDCRYSVEPAATCFSMSTWLKSDDCDLHYAGTVQHSGSVWPSFSRRPQSIFGMCVAC